MAQVKPAPVEPGAALKGQRVLVTGAGRGIGKAIALLCVEQGARVAVMSRTRDELAAVAREATSVYGVDVLTLVADVTKEDEVISSVARIVEEFGGIDILVNNAGRGCPRAVAHEQKPGELLSLLDLNVVSVLSVSGAVLRGAMLSQKKGTIINISSRAGKIGIAGSAPYCASKFALEGLSASMAEELKGSGIRVNTLSPGMVDTRSFPKAPGRPGVRAAESVRDGFMMLLESQMTGKYLHVDEFDQAREQGAPARALKSINEPRF